MGRFSSLLGKMKESRDELVRRAAKKAADAALDRTKDAARGALDSVSDTIERAIFGNVLKGDADKAPREKKDASEVPDPFAKLKAREREPAPAPPAPTPGAADDDVEAELGALKKRLGK